MMIVAAALVLPAGQTAYAADSYEIDFAHSSVEFSVKHMMVSNVKGAFETFSGAISYDPEQIENSSVEFAIDVSSVDTRNEKRDDHLRSEDFFDAKSHPEMTFKSKKIRKTDDGYVADGTLTIRGVSREVSLPFELNGPVNNPWGQTVMGIVVEYKLNRKDYGLVWNKTMDNGGLVVGDDVKVEINLEATRS
jgi:polyisoprenoid-binding protein YceI